MSYRFKEVTKEEPARQPFVTQIAKPERDRENTVIPKGFHVRYIRSSIARGAYRSRSQVSGAPTGGNGIGLVPAAFCR